MRRRRALQTVAPVLVAVLMAVMVGITGTDGLGASPVAAAAPVAIAPGVATVTLLQRSAIVGPGGHWQVRVRLAAPYPGPAEVRVTVYGRLTTRSDYAADVAGHQRGTAVWHSSYLGASDLATAGDGSVVLSLPVDAARSGRDLPTFYPADQSGVFPVDVELFDGRPGSVASLDTALVFVAGTMAQTDFPPLDVALTLPVHAAPALPAPGGVTTARAPAVLVRRRDGADGRSIAAVADEIALLMRYPEVTLSLAVTPETADALARRARGAAPMRPGRAPTTADRAREALSSLRGLIAEGDQAAPGTYVPTSLPELQAGGLTPEIAAQVASGTASLSADLRRRIDASTWLVDGPLDTATLSTLQGLGVNRLILPATDLASPPTSTTPSAPASLSTAASRLPVLRADAELGSYFRQGGNQVLAADQLLDDLAMIQLETPARHRGVAVLPPSGWIPTPPFVSTLLAGLRHNPLLSTVTIDGLFAASLFSGTRGSAPVVTRLVAQRDPPATFPESSAIVAARARIAGYSSLVPHADGVVGELSRRLLLAESTDLDETDRRGLLGSVDATVALVRHSIGLPGSTSITLTARKGSLPLSILSSAPFEAQVELRLTSDKLVFEPFSPPRGHCRESTAESETCYLTLAPSANTVKVPVESRTSGVFTLQVVLSSPDGSLVLGENQDTVRSTAVSGVGVVLIALALLGLAYWWIRNIRHGRRARQLIEPLPSADEMDLDEPSFEPAVPFADFFTTPAPDYQRP